MSYRGGDRGPGAPTRLVGASRQSARSAMLNPFLWSGKVTARARPLMSAKVGPLFQAARQGDAHAERPA